jgi:hypothetical protein
MKIYLAGYQASTTERESYLIDQGGVTARCLSFANIFKIKALPFFVKGIKEGYEVCVDKKVNIMMDSGVVSYLTYALYLKKHGLVKPLPDKDHYLQTYVDFCKRYGKLWDFYVTVDFRKHCGENFQIHQKLEKMGIRPVPVYHGDDTVDWLKKYKDRGYDFVCVGGVSHRALPGRKGDVKRRYLDEVFEAGEKWGLKFHGLAVTTAWMILEYPWKSCDSSSWSRAAGYGCIIRFDEDTGRMNTIHVSERHIPASAQRLSLRTNRVAFKALQSEIESEGYDFVKLQSDHTLRHLYNARTMLKLASAVGSKRRGWRTLF